MRQLLEVELRRLHKLMPRLWAPWRIEYIRSQKKDECFLCDAASGGDEEHLVLARSERALVIMNRFPYNSGHVMVCPLRHVADIIALEPEESGEVWKLVRESVRALREKLAPDAFNVGLNLGKAAGAGLEEHLHFHVVPRWEGDTNFMPVLSSTRVVPEALKETYSLLRPAFEGG